MASLQLSEKIRTVAKELDDAVERHDIPAVLTCFTDECSVELFGTTLHGKVQLEKALRWLYKIMGEIRFEPLTILINDEVFIGEFIFRGKKQKTEISIKATEVLIYEDYKVKILRLYLDGLQIATVMSSGFFEKSLLRMVNKKISQSLSASALTSV
jgi:hypothetical protein